MSVPRFLGFSTDFRFQIRRLFQLKLWLGAKVVSGLKSFLVMGFNCYAFYVYRICRNSWLSGVM